ncbi:MAG: hypothetical protein CR982_06610 [Candidatus Cloacimonadota bacterium]|nr:MAG: hypothetical protein CR982_06610 [Candidatus Cloacimonadota bacterium]PIE77846.1 MAG: hypothetical protein CSA15_11155 [Candidatus Delongbacteria bacterium]
MSNYVEIIAIVEGKTEEVFIKTILRPFLATQNIFIYATQITKPGEKGGDVRFKRAVKDIENHLKQRSDIFVTTFIDYYGIKEWPGIRDAKKYKTPKDIADTINRATKDKVVALFSNQGADIRFLPFIAIHEFETLLFSDSEILAKNLDIDITEVEKVLEECGEPERINNGVDTAPSKRLDNWTSDKKFKKTVKGIKIAKEIGIEKMREKCPLFNEWLIEVEKLKLL